MATSSSDAAERIGSSLAAAGLAPLPSRVLGALLVDDDGRMTSAELAAFLGVSASGVSGAVKYLEQVGMIRRERERGSRRDVYVVDDDAWHEAMLREQQVYAPIRAALETAMAAASDPAARRRLMIAREFLVFFAEETAALTARWETRKAQLLRDADG